MLITRPLFDKEWKDVPSIICYARDNMYPKEEYLIDLDTNALETLTPITDVVKAITPLFIKILSLYQADDRANQKATTGD